MYFLPDQYPCCIYKHIIFFILLTSVGPAQARPSYLVYVVSYLLYCVQTNVCSRYPPLYMSLFIIMRSHPSRIVAEHGLYMKHLKVEVYLLEFKLCLHPDMQKVVTKDMSRANLVGMCITQHLFATSEDRYTYSVSAWRQESYILSTASTVCSFTTSSAVSLSMVVLFWWDAHIKFYCVADLERELRRTFGVPDSVECRVWHRYMTSCFELLSNAQETLQDAGLYNGQVNCSLTWWLPL